MNERIERIVWSFNEINNIKYWSGVINGRRFYTINKFKDDKCILTSQIVPMKMMLDEDVESLQETAQILLESFVDSLKNSDS